MKALRSKIILVMLVISVTTTNVEIAKAQEIGIPIFEQIIGTEIEPGVYSEGDLLELRYKIDQAATGISLAINGSGYKNETVDMEFVWRDASIKYFKLEVQIYNYTIFKAYGLDEEANIASIEAYYLPNLKISYHRVWTTNDKYPEFISIDAVSDNVIEEVQFEYRVNTQANIRYKIRSEGNATLEVVTDNNKLFNNSIRSQMQFVEYDGDFQIFDYTLELERRELWFVIISQNSYEYSNDDQLVRRRIHNGYKFNNTKIEVIRNNKVQISERVTDRDLVSVSFDVLNETGQESYDVSVNRENITGTYPINGINILKPSEVNSNGTLISSYMFNISSMDWKDVIYIAIVSIDVSTGERIGVGIEMSYVVTKWGVIVDFEEIVKYTNQEEIELSFYINDVGDNGISNVTSVINSNIKTLPIDSRSVNVTLVEGLNEVIINVTNGLDESTHVFQFINLDNNPPSIKGMIITKSGIYHRLTANISEIKEHDVGIKEIQIGVNGIVHTLEVVEGINGILLSERVELSKENNTITLVVEDLAGNKKEQTIIYIIQLEQEEGSNTWWHIVPGVVLLVSIVLIVKRRMAS